MQSLHGGVAKKNIIKRQRTSGKGQVRSGRGR